jgi:hypothetical protein
VLYFFITKHICHRYLLICNQIFDRKNGFFLSDINVIFWNIRKFNSYFLEPFLYYSIIFVLKVRLFKYRNYWACKGIFLYSQLKTLGSPSKWWLSDNSLGPRGLFTLWSQVRALWLLI